MAVHVAHDEDARQFRANSDGEPAGTLRYRVLRDGTWDLYSTVVPTRFEGRGIGSALTREAVAAAVAAGAPVEGSCWFVAAWLQRHPEALEQVSFGDADVLENRRYWDSLAPEYVAAGERHWSEADPSWGIFGVPEEELRLLPGSLAGARTLELGCGTAYVSSWLTRRGATAVGIDNSPAQLATAARLRDEHEAAVELVLGDAHQLPFLDGEFDFAITEYGAVTWCDPHRWVPEAARVLTAGARLVVFGGSPWQTVCTPWSGDAVEERLYRNYFEIGRTSWQDVPIDPGGVQHDLTVSGWFELFSATGFTVDRFVEVPAPVGAADTEYVPAAWGSRFPAEQAWVLTRRAG